MDAPAFSPRRVKLRTPRLPDDVVVRPRLLARLNRMGALALIVAPAGYGKTTLVGSWLAQADLPSAWLSLDEQDNDPALFVAALTAAVATIAPGFGTGILEGINSPHTGTFADLAVLLINQLNELSDDFILVLDDYHVIHEPKVHQLLIDLITYPPRALHLVVTTRHEPRLPWRVRTRSSFCELRAADLSFTKEEAAHFFNNASEHPISSAATRSLVEQSGGWVTSLRLTALAIRIRGEDTRWAKTASAGFRNFSDYFGTELLSGLAQSTLSFLRRTSILDPLCGPLCDFVLAGAPGGAEPAEDSASVLRSLERIGAFTVALDDEGTWYRYHPLLREVLRHQLEQEAPRAEIAALYVRASAWLEERDLYDEALAYAFASGEPSRAVAFLQRRRQQLMDSFDWRRLERWLHQFPPPAIERHPELLLTRAWINQWHYNLPEIQVDLYCLEILLAGFAPDEPNLSEWQSEIATLRTQQHVARGDINSAIATGKLALAGLPPGQFYTRTIATVFLAWASQMAGQWEAARTIVDGTALQQGVPRDLAMARLLTLRAYINLPATNFVETRGDCPALLQIVSTRGIKTSIAWTHYFWACASYVQNDLHGAAEHFGAVLELVDHAHAQAYTNSAIGMALVYQAQGLPQEACSVVEGAKKTLTTRGQANAMRPITVFAADLAARQGRVEEALRYAAREERQFEHDAVPMFYVPGLAFVRVRLAAGTRDDLSTAEIWLERQLELAVDLHNTYAQIQCFALAAAVRDAQGDRPQALLALARALTLAENGQVVRVFVDLSRELAPLFDALAADKPLSVFSNRVYSALEVAKPPPTTFRAGATAARTFANAPAQDSGQGAGQGADQGTDVRDLRELLTYREMDVLKHLEQRLTNKEIAHALGISTETVRQHAVNLFRKLKVDNRRQAIVVARNRGYFDERR